MGTTGGVVMSISKFNIGFSTGKLRWCHRLHRSAWGIVRAWSNPAPFSGPGRPLCRPSAANLTARMAVLSVEESDVVVRFTPAETAFTWRRELRVPIERIRMVGTEPEPMTGLGLVRIPGVVLPGHFCYGASWWKGKREFVAVHAHQSAVVLDCQDNFWERVVVSTPKASELAAELAGIIMARGPGGCPPGRSKRAGPPL